MEYNNMVVGDHILISNFVRYERLTELINAEFYNSGYNEINLYIDAYSMIKSVYGLKPSQFIDKFSIASCIINACAHYRNFFWTRYKVTCKIWIVFSRMDQSILEARAFYPTYGNIFTMESNPEMDTLIQENMNVLNTLCPYIPDVHFIYSGYEPGLVFGRIITNEANSYAPTKPHIIISKDPWNLQVVGNLTNTYMIRPIKRNGEDLSILINNRNLLSYYEDLRKMKRDAITADPTILNSSLISFIIAATKFPERGMKSIHNLSSIVKYLTVAVQKLYISTDKKIYDIEGLCRDLSTVNKVNLKSFEIGLRMSAIGYDACMHRYIHSPLNDNIEIINLHDPESVKRINNTYFSKVPLDLMSL